MQDIQFQDILERTRSLDFTVIHVNHVHKILVRLLCILVHEHHQTLEDIRPLFEPNL